MGKGDQINATTLRQARMEMSSAEFAAVKKLSAELAHLRRVKRVTISDLLREAVRSLLRQHGQPVEPDDVVPEHGQEVNPTCAPLGPKVGSAR